MCPEENYSIVVSNLTTGLGLYIHSLQFDDILTTGFEWNSEMPNTDIERGSSHSRNACT